MKMKSTELIDQLQADVRQLILAAEYLKAKDNTTLTMQPAADKWSIAQVLAHLNSYGRYYLPAIQQSLAHSKDELVTWFKPGLIGNYFTKIMRPGVDGKIANKMQSPKDHRPAMIADAKAVVLDFIAQQHTLLELLEQARKKNIGRARTPISLTRFIKLKTGDTFRFLIAHEQRHFVQIANVLAQLDGAATAIPIANGQFAAV